MSAARGLTAAVHAAIAARGLAVHDHVPEDAALPYVTIGTVTGRPWSAKTFDGHEFRLILDCWSDAPGRHEVEGLMDMVRAALLEEPLVAADHRVVLVAAEGTDILRETETRIFHGILRLRVLMHSDDI